MAERSMTSNKYKVLFRDLFRQKSEQIINCIATIPKIVANTLYSAELIPQATKNNIVLAKNASNYDTASQLMVTIQTQSGGYTDPDKYLIDVCRALKGLQYHNKKLADIATSLLQRYLDIEPTENNQEQSSKIFQGSISASSDIIEMHGVRYRLVDKEIMFEYGNSGLLGTGSNETRVYKGILKNMKRKVAVKRIYHYKSENDEEGTASIMDEIQKLVRCNRHENIVQYYYYECDEEFVYLALELCISSIRKYVEKQKPFLDDLVVNKKHVLQDAMRGLQHLHSLKPPIIHRDVRPDNILLTTMSSKSQKVKAVLCDFGISTVIETGRESKTTVEKRGAWGWKAPEHEASLQSPSYDKRYPLEELCNEKYQYAKHLIEDMIQKDNNLRPSATDVLSHCYFWSREQQFFEEVNDYQPQPWDFSATNSRYNFPNNGNSRGLPIPPNYYDETLSKHALPSFVGSTNQTERSPCFMNTPSLTEITLHLQREQLQRAKNEHDSLYKVYVAAQNEVKERRQRLTNVKRLVSQTQSSIGEDELYMVECINGSLKYDIGKEKEKKRLHIIDKASISFTTSFNSWQCPDCTWYNNGLVPFCEKCPYTMSDQIIRRSGVPSISKVWDILCTEPNAIQHKWAELVHALGLNPDSLDIKDSDSKVIKLFKVLEKWRDTAPREWFTWDVLIKAVRKEYLSPAKAKEIELFLSKL